MKSINITLLCILSLAFTCTTITAETYDPSVSVLPEAFVLYKYASNNGTDPAAGIALVEKWLVLQEIFKISPQEAFVLLNHQTLKDLKIADAIISPIYQRIQSNQIA